VPVAAQAVCAKSLKFPIGAQLRYKMRSIAFLLFLCSCGNICDGADEYTNQEICVFFNGHEIDMDRVSDIIQITKEYIVNLQLSGYDYSSLSEAESSTSISFVDELSNPNAVGLCKYTDKFGDESTYEISLLVPWGMERIYNNVLPHEILHVYLFYVGFEEEDHPYEWFYEILPRITNRIRIKYGE